jgi:hypothetical protein
MSVESDYFKLSDRQNTVVSMEGHSSVEPDVIRLTTLADVNWEERARQVARWMYVLTPYFFWGIFVLLALFFVSAVFLLLGDGG